MKTRDATAMEWMLVAAAREIRDHEVVLAGTGLPVAAAMLAQHAHAPNCVIVFEAGAIDPRLSTLPLSVGDPRTLDNAAQAAGLYDVFAYLLQGGRVDVGFLGGAQVDRFGNVNSTSLGPDYRSPEVRLSGSGGAADIAALAGRTVIVTRHERRRLVEAVDYCTSPGWIAGGSSRAAAGLNQGGPSALVTTMGVIRYRPGSRQPYLSSCHGGFTPEQVQAETGFDLDIEQARPTPCPAREELELLRERVDPKGVMRAA